ncbi:dephospho-CoA kinase [Salinimicrobium catena]|uniref:Dephospho-CoA kinase n=1 Tax=Salinimicrobium catena TaxID=390640 RepID=A0A1H5L150_9FLAO|nr:dephospho-CoA kinase [Salinimicrobium catena]SDL04518.1 dephospho-CoA kinase [Salinimicrobium catena]SEE70859.1 dephospho-CoA kinase [Salinimicrobium catena]
MKVLGLTGGIGSGKTTVANMFRELGVPVYIADDEAKKLMNSDPEVREQITSLFGEAAYNNGMLNRKLLASRVFSDKELLEKLNAIVHPAVGKHFEEWKKIQTGVYVIYEAAILFEKGGYRKCDKNLMITAPLEVKIARIMARDGSTRKEIQARMNNQWPDEKKAKMADFILSNIDLAETRREVRKIHQMMLNGA